MQILRSILQIGSGGTRLTDEFGSETGVSLELMLGTAVRMEFDLRREASKTDGQLPVFPAAELSDCANYFALDVKNSNSNTPALLKYSGITLRTDSEGHNILTVELENNSTDAVISAIGTEEYADFRAEIGGVDAGGITVFAWQFDLSIRSRVYLGNGDETVLNDPQYYTAVQTVAMLNDKGNEIANELQKKMQHELSNPMEFEYSVDGVSDWHSAQTSEDRYYRQRIANINSEWSEAVMMAPGQQGEPGKDGEDGKDGEPGYTPQKGVDYWTDAYKADIKKYVDDAILNGTW